MRDSQPPCQALPCPRRTPHATAWAPGALPGVACTLASWSLMLLLVLQEHLAACSRLQVDFVGPLGPMAPEPPQLAWARKRLLGARTKTHNHAMLLEVPAGP